MMDNKQASSGLVFTGLAVGGLALGLSLARKEKEEAATKEGEKERREEKEKKEKKQEQVIAAEPQSKSAGLRMITEIQLFDRFKTSIRGRLDHCGFDKKHKLLFVTCLAANCVAIVDCFACTTKEILLHHELNRPQGVLFVEQDGALYVANAGNGKVVIFLPNAARTSYAGSTPPKNGGQPGHSYIHNPAKDSCDHGLVEVVVVDFEDEADNLRYDAGLKLVLVGYGEGAIGFIDPDSHKRCAPCIRVQSAPSTYGRLQDEGDFVCLDHPEGFQRAPDGRIFVNIADKKLVQVVQPDGETHATWPLPEGFSHNFPLCLDYAGGRVFVGCRRPSSCVVVYRIDDGSVVATVPCAGDMDDLYYDQKRGRLYVLGGEGKISVISTSKKQFEVISTVSSSIGARTGLWYVSRDRLYVAAPAAGGIGARVLVYEPF